MSGGAPGVAWPSLRVRIPAVTLAPLREPVLPVTSGDGGVAPSAQLNYPIELR